MYVCDGKILVTAQTTVLDRNAKASYLVHYCKQNGIDPIDTTTNGDEANDLAMLQAAGMGLAFEDKPLLLAEVAIQLNHTDLRGLRYHQGYKQRDFNAEKISTFSPPRPDKRGRNQPLCS